MVESAPAFRARRVLRASLLPILVALAFVHPLATLLARLNWGADLLTHFQGLGLLATFLAIAVLARKRWRLSLALIPLAVLQAEPLLRYEWANPVPPRSGATERLRILMANVLYDNVDHESLIRLIRAEHPDVVGLVELTDGWLTDLEPVRREFAYRLEVPAEEGPGLALWFRKEPASIEGPEWPTPEGWPFLRATFPFAGRSCRLWLVHPASPMRMEGRRQGVAEMNALAKQAGQSGGSRIVVGDLNCTAGSPKFADFLRVSGLRDSRLGFGLQPSWPCWSPYRIAIDHAFLSDDLAVADRRLGPYIGSDHRPLILDVAPAAAMPAARSSAQASQASR